MGKTRVAINGFGRIGRLAFRLGWNESSYDVVHVNEIAVVESSAYLAKYDSVHGTWDKPVEAKDGNLLVDGKVVTYSQAKTVAEGPWKEKKIDVVLECTGVFLTREKLQPYFDAGVKKVIVSAPVKEDVLNIVYGCNDEKYDPKKDHLITAASCTTNCLAPVVKVIQENFGIVKGCITTVHNVTNTQTIVDAPNSKKSDLRRGRSGLCNLAPTSTGSATAVTLVYPELKGKLNGLAIRVPLLNGSITDCVFDVGKTVTVEEINKALKKASESGSLKGILGYEEQPLVSTDFINDKRSGIVDALSTMVIDGTMVKLYVWYDNEYGYSCRMVDICKMVVKKL